MNLPSKLGFLQRRTFWGVVLGLVATLCIFTLYQFVNNLTSFDSRVWVYVEASFGSLFWSMMGYRFWGDIGAYCFSVAYFLSIAYLVRQTFKSPIVFLRYPFILIILYVIGFQFATMFFSGL